MRGESLRRAGRAVGHGFRLAYDHTGMTVLLSALWFVFGFVPVSLTLAVTVQIPTAVNAYMVALLAMIFLFGPVTAMVYGMVDRMYRREPTGMRDLIPVFKQHYGAAAKITAVMALIFVVLVVDVNFFLASESTWMVYIGFAMIYLLAFWVLMFQYTYAVTVSRRRTVLETLRVTALLVLDNLLVSFVILAVGAVWIFLTTLIKVLLVLFTAGAMAFLHVSGFRTLLAKYEQGDEADEDEAKSVAADGDDGEGESS